MSHLGDLRRLVVLAVFTMIAALIVPVATAPPASAQGVTDCTAATISKADCDALVDLYNATGGAATWVSKANWLLGDNPCGWYGVTCSNATGGSVTLLNLYNNKLSDEIPASIGDLTNLQTLNLSGNDLSDAIPTEIGNLTNLQVLYLFDNDLSDEIPASIGNLTNLQTLYLSDNELSGPIPSSIGNLASLRGLYLSGNGLSGEIPASIGDLINLLSLALNPNGCLWASGPVAAFVTGAIDKTGTNGAALDDACKPPPVVCGALCEGVTVLEGPNECGVVKVQVPSGLMGLLDLSVPVSVDSNQVVFEGLLPSDGIISFTYPDGSGPVFTFGATLINGGNYTSTVTILAPTTAPAAGCEPATETADTETADTAPDAVAAAVAAPLLAFTGTGSGLTQLALAITGADALMMTASRRRR